MEAKPVTCTVKPMHHIKIGDHKVDFHSGCSVVEVTFPNVFYVEIGEIHFKNYYTAWLSIKARMKNKAGDGRDMKWHTCVKRQQLMPHPHSDTGAEDYFTIGAKQILTPLSNISGLRFILRQPSPLWKEFKIDDIRLYKVSHTIPPEVPLPNWMNDQHKAKEDEMKDKQIKGIPSIPALSRDLQQLWALTGQVEANQPSTPLGRYDVEGSYEINLLSYT